MIPPPAPEPNQSIAFLLGIDNWFRDRHGINVSQITPLSGETIVNRALLELIIAFLQDWDEGEVSEALVSGAKNYGGLPKN